MKSTKWRRRPRRIDKLDIDLFYGTERISIIWGLRCQKQVSQAWISNCLGCNYLSLSGIPVPGTNVLICPTVSVAPSRAILSAKLVYRVSSSHDISYWFISSISHGICTSWWRHQMETFSALLTLCAGNSPVTGEFPSKRPVTRSFDVFSHLRLNKRLSKQSGGWWFETPLRSLWRHRNVAYRVSSSHYIGCWLVSSISQEICTWFAFCCVLLWLTPCLPDYFIGTRSTGESFLTNMGQ